MKAIAYEHMITGGKYPKVELTNAFFLKSRNQIFFKEEEEVIIKIGL